METPQYIDGISHTAPKWCCALRIGVARDFTLTFNQFSLKRFIQGSGSSRGWRLYLSGSLSCVWLLFTRADWMKGKGRIDATSLWLLSVFWCMWSRVMRCSMHVCSAITCGDECKSSAAKCIHWRTQNIVTLSCTFWVSMIKISKQCSDLALEWCEN